MVDRTDLVSVLLYVFFIIGGLLLFVAFGGIGPLASVAAIAGPLFIFVYPAYWALSMRRALAVRLYRRQALGIGLISIAFLAASLDSTGTAYGVSLLVIFYWIDTSFSAARRADPLLRDTLHWNKIRTTLWVVCLVGIIPFAVYAVVSGDYSVNLNPNGIALVTIAPGIVVPASAIGLFLVGSRRSKDMALTRHLVWFGLFVIAQFATILVSTVNTFAGTIWFIGFGLGGFCLYKSARSLVPLNKISPVELTTPLRKETSLGPSASGQLIKVGNVHL